MCEAMIFLPSTTSWHIETASPLLYLVLLYLFFLLSCLLLCCCVSIKKKSNSFTGKTKKIMQFEVLTVVLLWI